MGTSPFRVALTALYIAGLGCFAYFLVAGAGYYLTPVAERAVVNLRNVWKGPVLTRLDKSAIQENGLRITEPA